MNITKITLEVDGKKIDVYPSTLSNALRKKLRKETEKYIHTNGVKQIITEPTLNEVNE